MSTFTYRAHFSKKSAPFDQPTVTHTFDTATIVVPASWSSHAAGILANLYARQAVPLATRERPGFSHLPAVLRPHVAITKDLGPETHYQQIIHRIAGSLAYGGVTHGILDVVGAEALYHDLAWLISHQVVCPNSPQWFNAGMHWAYGLTGSDVGLWALNPTTQRIERCYNTYEHPQLAACFILSLEDSLTGDHGILSLIDTEARIFRSGSGSGTNISKLREKGAPLAAGGTSSGMLSFARIGDTNAGAIKSGGTTRRAAKMYVCDASHPDVEDFIRLKAREEQKVAALVVGSRELAHNPERDPLLERVAADLTTVTDAGIPSIALGELDTSYLGDAYGTVTGQNANNSVRWRDEFFAALDTNANVTLTHVKDGTPATTASAKRLWNLAAACAWFVGDPGYQFPDTMARWHTTPHYGPINATNPCGEYIAIDDSACNLGTLNLGAFLHGHRLEDFDVDSFRRAAHTLALMLDITVSVSGYPSETIARNSDRLRNLGANLTNLGGVLMLLGLPYDDPRSRALAGGLHSLLTAEVYRTSAYLAKALGPSTAFIDNAEDAKRVIRQHAAATKSSWSDNILFNDINEALPPHTVALDTTLVSKDLRETLRYTWETTIVATEEYGLRSLQATVAAPTGSVSFLLDAQTFSIEPEYAVAKEKLLADGRTIKMPCALLALTLQNLGYPTNLANDIMAYAAETGTLLGAPHLDPTHEPIFRTATGPNSLPPSAHIDMVAAISPHVSGGISKTVNLPNDATIADIAKYARRAYDLGIKGLTFFRDSSKLSQPLKRVGSTKQSCPTCNTENVVPTGACAICTNCQTQIGGC